MSKELVSDELWEIIEPLLPEVPPKPKGQTQGRQAPHRRPRGSDRHRFRPEERHPLGDAAPGDGLRLGIDLLAEVTRLAAGGRVGRAPSGALGPPGRGRPDRLGAGVFGLGERAGQKGGRRTGPNPTDKGKAGSKRHVVADRGGVPLAVVLTAANVHDSKVLEEAVDAIEPIKRPRGLPGRPRKRPKKLHADKAYDFPRCREALRKRSIKARIARRGIDSSEKLGRYRWAVERTLSWANRFRRLKVRYERRDDIHQAFLDLGCALISWRYVQRLC